MCDLVNSSLVHWCNCQLNDDGTILGTGDGDLGVLTTQEPSLMEMVTTHRAILDIVKRSAVFLKGHNRSQDVHYIGRVKQLETADRTFA